MNASPSRNKSENDNMFAAFCKENSLVISPHTPSEPTYGDVSVIQQITTNIRNPINTSNHDALNATLLCEPHLTSTSKVYMSAQQQCKPRTKWEKVDRDEYYSSTGAKIKTMVKVTASGHCPDLIVQRIYAILYDHIY